MPAMIEPPNRHWYQFSLRTLLIGVALLAVPMGYVGWQAKIVRERRAMLDMGNGNQTEEAEVGGHKDASIPLIRRWLGDHFCATVFLKHEADFERYQAAFPEAEIFLPAPPAPPARNAAR
jgi:hypothetical protein